MGNSDWLKNLKVGDTAAIPGEGINEGLFTTVTVQKITPTGRITVVDKKGTEYKFNQNGTSLTGGPWHFTHLKEITPEMTANHNKKRLVRLLSNQKWEDISLESMQQIYDILKNNK
jgi:hypothetical protein